MNKRECPIYREGTRKMYTHFQKEKNYIKIVILHICTNNKDRNCDTQYTPITKDEYKSFVYTCLAPAVYAKLLGQSLGR